MSVLTISQAISDALDAIDGLRPTPYAPDSLSPPAAFVALPEITYDLTTMGCKHTATFPVYVVLSKVTDRTASANLAPYLAASGSQSVKAAIETDYTLDGTVDTVRVTGARPVTYTSGGVDYLAAQFDVETEGDLA